ncbi:hypothetical protein BO86DRAFT_101822 [Aspergillus japonicus CBS 114.51]|uniref:Uncharacterized protein n=1 Tax=Aspergillus japonicus CBS 114.51 TaxID=1448312 RepID=A0A8T8WZ82_ASPJA|nr:hypothetical protein BO86DRAFT_101822 [Aspergillus japonicus CBS 114.51]RAH81163.1 hypothetical protein BO86DRAFT_101822 [Aspergillus japonicus CBS 114.51]
MAPLMLGILPTTLARESLESASGCDGTAEIHGLITPLNGQAAQPRPSRGQGRQIGPRARGVTSWKALSCSFSFWCVTIGLVG